MDHESSEDVIPGHDTDLEPTREQALMQVDGVYEGFEDLTVQGPWTIGEY
jgi:hypothetical protein